MELKNEIRFGIIGYGFMGQTHAKNIIAHPNATLSAIFSLPNKPVEITGVSVYTEEWRDVINDEDVDAVVIATPTTTHLEIATYAAQKKKQIFLEKPMARTVEQCQQIIDAAKEHNVNLFIAHVLRFFPAYENGKNNAIEENIGGLKMIRAIRYSTHPNWSVWFFDEEQSGSVILDLSIHDIDFSMWVMNGGNESNPVVEVYCQARKFPEMKINTYAMSMTTLKFKNGQIAYCEASWMAENTYGFGTNTEIIGDAGIITYSSNDKKPLHFFEEHEKEIVDPFIYSDDGYYKELNSFIQSLINGTQCEVSGEEGKIAVAVALAALKSAKEKRPIKMEEII